MAKLIRYNSTIGFRYFDQDPKKSKDLITLYVPRSNSEPKEEYESVKDVLEDDGFFIQYIYTTDLNENKFLENARRFVERQDWRAAFAFAHDPNDFANGGEPGFLYFVKRNEKWKQNGGNNIRPPHLYNMVLAPKGTGGIISDKEDDKLFLIGNFDFKVYKGSKYFVDNVILKVNLADGKLRFDFKTNEKFFNFLPITAPLFLPQSEDSLDPDLIYTGIIDARIFNIKSLSSKEIKSTMMLSLYDEGMTLLEKNFKKCDLDDKDNSYLKEFGRVQRYVIKNNEIVFHDINTIEFNSTDTVGRVLKTSFGGEKQSLRFLPNFSSITSKKDSHNIISEAKLRTFVIPEGLFPILPEKKCLRRFKFGPSNAEFLEINNNGSDSQIALRFLNMKEIDKSREEAGLGAGFLQRAFEKWGISTGNRESLTNWAYTVWPEYTLQTTAEYTLQTNYSAQPDNMILYGYQPGITALDENAVKVLPFNKSLFSLETERLPFSFYHGYKDETNFGELKFNLGEIESIFSEHRAKERQKKGRPFSFLENAFTSEQKPSVTPQTFIVNKTSEEWEYTLARTKNEQGVDLSFKLIIVNPALAQIMQQNEFLIVLPRDTIFINNKEVEGVKFESKIKIGEWAFNLPFNSKNKINDESSTSTNDPLVILKYKEGAIDALLQDPKTWTNRDLLNGTWIEKAKTNGGNWLDGIKIRKDSEPAYKNISDIINDPKWTGVLLINPSIDLGNLPDSLQGISSGLNMKLFKANHLGFTLNRTEIDTTGIPSIKESSLFGLIDYIDKVEFEENKFEFKVKSILAVFNNSEINDFKSEVKIKFPNFFDDNIDNIEGGTDAQNKENVFTIRGQYDSHRDANGNKITTYSFIHDKEISILKENWSIFNSAKINRIEIRTEKTEGDDTSRNIETALIINATVDFKTLEEPIDIIGFKQLHLENIRTTISTKFSLEGGSWHKSTVLPDSLIFGHVKLQTDPNRRREESLLSKFPVKFKTFHAFDGPTSLDSLNFMGLFGSDKDKKVLKYGFEFDVDFGTLAKLLGLDSSLTASLMVGWVPQNKGGFSFCCGISFPDFGGRELDLSLGSIFRIKADYFDIFNVDALEDKYKGKKQFILVANNISVKIFNVDIPQDTTKTQFGLIIAPDVGNPLASPAGWITSLQVDRLAFFDNFFLAIGQSFEYIGGKDTPSDIINDVKVLEDFKITGTTKEGRKKESEDYRKRFKGTFQYNKENEWFIAFQGKGGFFEVSALYNPPSRYGGQVLIKDLLEISVLYKQLTPETGLYTGTLTLADALRSIDFGAVRIQLPRLMLQMDTEGGYGLNVGLNLDKLDDFSNAAGAEITIYKGNAGFMFARLHGAAFKQIPKLKNNLRRKSKDGRLHDGTIYSPATQVILAGRFGLGREFNVAILRAGVSITIYGILSGISATRNENIQINYEYDKNFWNKELPDKYYRILGEVGILAEIYGIVDFGVTRIRFDARLLVGFGIVFETWRGTTAYIRGELSIELEWVIAQFQIFGNTITISIHLSFKAEFRQDINLDAGDSRYNDYFESATLFALPAKNLLLKETQGFDVKITPKASTEEKKVLELISTLDLTLNDLNEPILVPLLFVPFTEPTEPAKPDNIGAFAEIIKFIFDWSIRSLYGVDIKDEDEVTPEEIRKVDGKIAEIKRSLDPNDHDQWVADAAWGHIKNHFSIIIKNEGSGQKTAGTVFSTPKTIKAELSKKELKTLGNINVNEKYIEDINELFDDLRIYFNKTDEHGVYATGTRLLIEYLFEEYIESILRAIWGRLAMRKWVKKDGQPIDTVTIGNLRKIVMQCGEKDGEEGEAFEISGMINRQYFSGSRVPDGKEKTVTIVHKCDLFISCASITGADKGAPLTLKYDNDDLKQSVSFPINDEVDSEKIKKLYGDALTTALLNTTIEINKPYRKQKPTFAVIENLPVKGNSFHILEIPAMLIAEIDKSKRKADNSWQGLEVRLIRQRKEEFDPDKSDQILIKNAAMLINLPVRQVKTNIFELRVMGEADRQLLNKFLFTYSQYENVSLTLLLDEKDARKDAGGELVDDIDAGRIVGFKQLNLENTKSFIGRINLSTDKNPTHGVWWSRREAFSLDVTTYHASIDDKVNFLTIINDAAETNSGGYFLSLEERPSGFRLLTETEEIGNIRLLVKWDIKNNLLPITANKVIVENKIGNEQLQFMDMRERSVTVGEPGVVSLKITRKNPNTLYMNPFTGVPSLKREEAIAQFSKIVEMGALKYSSSSLQDFQEKYLRDLKAAIGDDQVKIAKRFNLMQVELGGNSNFIELSSKLDLPTPPMSSNKGNENNKDKDYQYEWNLPAYKFYDKTKVDNDYYEGESDEKFIYAGIGEIIKGRVSFRDVLGYCPVSDNKEFPDDIIVQYFDTLQTFELLPGIKFNHFVTNKPSEGLKLVFNVEFNWEKLTYKAEIKQLRTGKKKNKYKVMINKEDKKRLEPIILIYKRAIQQVRDLNMSISVMCPLGFKNNSNKIMIDNKKQRGDLLKFLENCVEVIDNILEDQPPGSKTIALSGWEFDIGTNIKNITIDRYEVKIKWERPKDKVITELQNTNSDVWNVEVLIPYEKEMKDLQEKLKNNKLLIASSRDIAAAEAHYLIAEKLVKVTTTSEQPVYASLLPLANNPYSCDNAIIDNLSTNPATKEKITIYGFDQDEAFHLFLQDMDEILSIETAHEAWSSNQKDYDSLLGFKNTIAKNATNRLAVILERDNQRFNVVKQTIFESKKLENSFKKKLRSIFDIDTIVALPVSYDNVDDIGEVLLYGELAKSSIKNTSAIRGNSDKDETGEASQDRFLPVALERKGNSGVLIAQFDAKQEGRKEIFYYDASYKVTHLYWKKNDNSKWLTLLIPYENELCKNNKPWQIPVLYKKLVKKPILSNLQGKSNWGGNWNNIRKWTFSFVVEREQAVMQDDVFVNVDYNLNPYEEKNNIFSTGRSRGLTLFEFVRNRETLKSKNLADKIQYYHKWASKIASGINTLETFKIESLEQIHQEYEIVESINKGDSKHVVTLYGLNGKWDATIEDWKRNGSQGPFQSISIKKLQNKNKFLRLSSTREPLYSIPINGETKTKDSEYYAGRKINVQYLDVLKYESAKVKAKVVRNFTLGSKEDGSPIYDDVTKGFKYETDEVISDSYTPYLEIEDNIEINESGDLKTILKNFIDAVFKEIDQANYPEIDIAWGYDSGELDALKKEDMHKNLKIFGPDPIAMFIPRELSSADGSEEVASIVKSIKDWEGKNGGPPSNGYYVFDLRIYARLKNPNQNVSVPRPLLRLKSIRVLLSSGKIASKRSNKSNSGSRNIGKKKKAGR